MPLRDPRSAGHVDYCLGLHAPKYRWSCPPCRHGHAKLMPSAPSSGTAWPRMCCSPGRRGTWSTPWQTPRARTAYRAPPGPGDVADSRCTGHDHAIGLQAHVSMRSVRPLSTSELGRHGPPRRVGGCGMELRNTCKVVQIKPESRVRRSQHRARRGAGRRGAAAATRRGRARG